MDWIAGLGTLISIELIARRRWYGWLVGVANQVLWVALIWERELWGLAPLSLVLLVRYSVAAWAWRKEG